jgi:3-hydroxymyristoyl/3-hydroxydecanoyl-(acyl carrier protein) dehydratase
VTPGDQIEIHAKLIRQRSGKIGVTEGTCKIGDKVVSSALLRFMLLENKES